MNTLRHAFRSLRSSPGFALVAIFILTVGIGASTAIFSVVYAILLKPLAYRDAGRIVHVQSQHPQHGVSGLAPATLADLARESHSFSAVAGQQYYYVNLTKTAAPTRVTALNATANYFNLFGVPPTLGRTWNQGETLAGANQVVVLGDALWHSQFNARPDIIGEQVMIDDVAHTVIGVMPATFTDPWGNAQLWRPIAMNDAAALSRTDRSFSTFACLKADVSLARANVELQTFAGQLAKAYPKEYQGWTLAAFDLQGQVVGDYRTGLLVVLGAVACVMLITCANVAGLSLVRAIGRRKELAVRTALGASRRQLLLQLLTESLLLSLIGGALGVLLANWGISAIIALVGDGWLPRVGEITINAPVLLVSLALTLLTGIAFGLLPAWSASRVEANDALRDNTGRGSAGPASRRLRSSLVVVELALALMLLVGASLLAQSFTSVLARNPGLRTGQVLTLGLSLPAKRYDSTAKALAFYTRVEEAVAAVPGVISAGFTQTLPFTWGNTITLTPTGSSNLSAQDIPPAYYDSVSVNFLRTAGIPLVAGRNFAGTDDPKAPGVVMISNATARRFFGSDNPIGRHLHSVDPARPAEFEIVGVTGDVLRTGLAANETPLQIYRPLAQRPPWFATLMIHTAVPPEAVAKSVQQAIWSIDPDQAIEALSPLSRLVSNSITQPRLYLVLFALFAGIALVLASVGLYGLVAYGVAQRTREFGIRTALGASPRDVLRLVLREGFGLILIGLGCGLLGALAASRLLQTMVFATAVNNPVIFVAVSLLLAAVALLACWLPARRATKVDPLVALRAE